MDQLLRIRNLVDMSSASTGKSFGKVSTVQALIVPLLACSVVTTLLAYLPSDILLMVLAAIVAWHSYETKKPNKKAPHPRTFGCKSATSETAVTLAPTLKSTTFDEQIEEMITKMTPKSEDIEAVDNLVRSMHHTIINELSLDAAVCGFAYASPFVEAPLAKIEPEISVVVNVDLARYHQAHKDKQNKQPDFTLESAPKNIIRRIKKCLLSKHDFKLRRFNFAESTRLMLNAPVLHGTVKQRVCVQIAVNNTFPIHGAKLMDFCTKSSPMAADLVLLVQQWTRWRSICLVDKGDLPPYIWTILAIFYLQANKAPHFPVLPAVEGEARANVHQNHAGENPLTLSELFKGFFKFYAREFDFNTEVVAVSDGKRCKWKHKLLQRPHSDTPLCVEDPFQCGENLTSSVSAQRFRLLTQEFSRADTLCSSNAALATLFIFPEHIYEQS